MTKHSLLISDLHLCDARPELTEAFEQFCAEHAANAQALYILGDLSDAWIGDDDDSESANRIRAALSSLTKQSVKVFIMTGNRDFLIGKQLADACNAEILTDPSVIDLHGHKSLLLHGDSLCIDDEEYMAFRAQIQNPAAQQMLLAKPLEERRQIAAMLRSKSKSANSNKAEDIMDVNADEVTRQLQIAGVELMIHGHTHRPAVHELGSKGSTTRRMVLGDWGDKAWYIKADADGQELISYTI